MRDPGALLRGLITSHLNPHEPGPQERDALWTALTHNDALRGEYALHLTSQPGQEAWLSSGGSEAAYQAWLAPHTSMPMQQLLKTIRMFERLARVLTGDVLKLASADCFSAYRDAVHELGEVDPGLRMRAERAFAWVGEVTSPASFATHLLEHHGKIQKAKPPNGKRPWFDTFGDGRVAIRPGYTVTEFAPQPATYVQAYRTKPIWSFARDLGRIAMPTESV